MQCVYRTNSLFWISRNKNEREKKQWRRRRRKRDKSRQLMTKVFVSNNSSSNKQKAIQMRRKEYLISDVHNEESRMFLRFVLPLFFAFYFTHLTPFSSLNLFNTSDSVHKDTQMIRIDNTRPHPQVIQFFDISRKTREWVEVAMQSTLKMSFFYFLRLFFHLLRAIQRKKSF